MLYGRLIYMLSMLYVRLTIKVKLGIPESFKVGWYPHKITRSHRKEFVISYFFDGDTFNSLILSLTYSMDNIQINLHYSIKFLAIGGNVTWSQCHASLGSESKFCCCRHFFRQNLSATHSAHQYLALNIVFQNRKDAMREIQRFLNLGHNLCENDKQTLNDYI